MSHWINVDKLPPGREKDILINIFEETFGMSNLQVTNYGLCGECKWHRQDDYHKEDWICVNSDSDYCTEYTEYTDTCPMWEQRGME